MSKIFISVDMEGCSGIVSRQETMPAGAFYEEARQWMLWDTNAAVEGCLNGGATEVVVCDFHTRMNIPWDEIHPRAKLVRSDSIGGRILYLLEGLDDTFDAVFFVGQHTAYGDPKGIISHSFTRPFRHVHFNGQRVGEIEIWTALAGHFGVPVGLVTGDDVTCQQAKGWLPQLDTAVVKYAIDTYAARCLPKDQTHRRICEAACQATKAVSQLKPFCFSAPVEVKIDLVMPNAAGRICLMPGVERTDGTQILFTAESFWDAYKMFVASAWLAMSANDPLPC
ncbi:MAG: peptidase M55 [Planctomycetes bacterium]|jgi:D-amino peptidase|nr:peptidase M55 [Planctomycetota bacterium]